MNILESIKKDVEKEFTETISAPIKQKLQQLLKLKIIIRKIQNEIEVLIKDSAITGKDCEDIFKEFVSLSDDKKNENN